MRLSAVAAVFCLILSSAAFAQKDIAGWSAAKWGMSAAEVRHSVAAAEPLADPPQYRLNLSGLVGLLEAKNQRVAGLTASVRFLFPSDAKVKGLTAIVITPEASDVPADGQFRMMEEALVEKYGKPTHEQNEQSDSPRSITRRVFWALPKTSITLTYIETGGVIPYELTDLVYKKRSDDSGL